MFTWLFWLRLVEKGVSSREVDSILDLGDEIRADLLFPISVALQFPIPSGFRKWVRSFKLLNR